MKCKIGFKEKKSKCMKIKTTQNKMKQKEFNKWWAEHWDEVMLVGGLAFSALLILNAKGIF